MSRSFSATADIAAAPEAVWAVLVDTGRWTAWDSGVTGVDGAIAPGATITIRSAAAPGRAFPVAVRELEPGRRLVLAGGMPLGLFRGVRTYTLDALPEGGTRFRMEEVYGGLLLPVMWRSMPDLGPSFRQFAEGLRRRVEVG